MTGTRSDNSVDQAAMLLSTDWFLPHWALIGIQADQPSKEQFQMGCRDIVLQFIDGAEDYYLINFSEERTEVTRGRMRALADACKFRGDAKANIEDLIKSKPHRTRFHTIAWLFMTVIKKLIDDDQLDFETKALLSQSEVDFSAYRDVDFKRLCMKSKSQWDTYVRGLTPELPGTLSDLLSVSLLSSRQLRAILQALTSAQRTILFSQFKSAAQSWMGAEVEESDWPDFE